MEFSEQELENMARLFTKMGMSPKSENPEDFKEWLLQTSEQWEPEVKKEDSFDKNLPTFVGPTSVAYQPFPKLPFFSGEQGRDAEYDIWRYEVDCLLDSKTHSYEQCLQAIRKSLKGEAAMIAMKLGYKASVPELLSKLKSAFGTLRCSSSLLSEFYSTRQADGEDVAAWSRRLERLLFQLCEQKSISTCDQNDMLRTRLWDGLTPALKNLAGYKYEAIKDFDELRLCLREFEFEMNRDKVTTNRGKVATVKMVSGSESVGSDISELKSMMAELKNDMAELRQKQQSQQQCISGQVYQQTTAPVGRQSSQRSRQPSFRGRGSSSGWRRGFDVRSTSYPSSSNGNTEPHFPQTAESHQQLATSTRGGHTSAQSDESSNGEPICWRCGYPGHLAYGCRVRLDHIRHPLNRHRPMERGQP